MGAQSCPPKTGCLGANKGLLVDGSPTLRYLMTPPCFGVRERRNHSSLKENIMDKI